jgi:hypothetical protein
VPWTVRVCAALGRNDRPARPRWRARRWPGRRNRVSPINGGLDEVGSTLAIMMVGALLQRGRCPGRCQHRVLLQAGTRLFYGRKGLVLNVISAVDLALHDLLGRLRQEPVTSCWAARSAMSPPSTPPVRDPVWPSRWTSSAGRCPCTTGRTRVCPRTERHWCQHERPKPTLTWIAAENGTARLR